jgi:hypothetical protein
MILAEGKTAFGARAMNVVANRGFADRTLQFTSFVKYEVRRRTERRSLEEVFSHNFIIYLIER